MLVMNALMMSAATELVLVDGVPATLVLVLNSLTFPRICDIVTQLRNHVEIGWIRLIRAARPAYRMPFPRNPHPQSHWHHHHHYKVIRSVHSASRTTRPRDKF
jgi:hypothetical protein